MLRRGFDLRLGRGGPSPIERERERALQTRRKAEWCAERPAVVLTSHSISGSHRCKRHLVLPALSPASACSQIIICQVITTSVTKSLQTASSIEVGFPHAARHIPRCSTLHHHSPKLQETSSQRMKVLHREADPTSSEHRTGHGGQENRVCCSRKLIFYFSCENLSEP
jgi:hypothetical protein